MKRFLLATLAIAGISICSFGQTKTTTRVEKKAKVENTTSAKTSTGKMAPKTNASVTTKTSTSSQPASATTTTKTTTTSAGPTKKDGTPDMRYKVNKESVKTTKLKKDGTPDMRYKQNKKS